MSQPDQDQPFAGPDPRLGQQSVPAQPQLCLPPQAYWQPSPPAPKHNIGLRLAGRCSRLSARGTCRPGR